ncbi:hypothetical protein FUAX_29410 [Fulvitalea axinellae]|uniref:Uncharacterized protein n=1 Tax=Fulvitalea axinellae TaxID=1182444 RepID=A0AAU9CVI2_9BACT|nr:hypothetical protein FUAX_29410 [Fulvitalea axinellae]
MSAKGNVTARYTKFFCKRRSDFELEEDKLKSDVKISIGTVILKLS